MKKNVLLIGGFGFLGRNLLEALESDYNVIVFDRGVPPDVQNIVSFRGDFTNKDDLEQVFHKSAIDLVIHCVSTTIPSNTDIIFDIHSNVIGTIQLLELMKKYSVPKIVFLSSGGTVYGVIEETQSVDELHPTFPICSHGISKLTIERYIHLYHHLYKIDYLILRLSNPFGEHHISDKHGFINVALKKIVHHEAIEVWGDGEVVRDYVYVKDCASIIKELLQKNISNEIFNVGSGTGLSINQILSLLEKKYGKLNVRWQEKRNFDVPKIVLNITKLQSIIKHQFTPLERGIHHTYDWLKNQS